MPLDALILDLDGTLVDTNSLHIEAWRRALERHGYKIASDRIKTEVGKGGDQLVPSLLGNAADKKDGDSLRKAQPEELAKLAAQHGINPFPHAVDLLKTFRDRGMQTCLATSSNAKQLDLIEHHSNVQWRKLVDKVVTADDAEKSKPHPDLVIAAVDKLNLAPTQCAMLGDTPYDATAAKHAGVVSIALECGGNPAQTLLSAGARLVYPNPSALLDDLDNALRRASPTTLRLTKETNHRLMQQALDLAHQAISAAEAPIASILYAGDGSEISRAHNEMNARQDKTAHAEILAFARSAGKVPMDAKDLILVSTLEPCVMCTGAAMIAGVDTILYALKAPADSGTVRVSPPSSPESQMPRIVGGILADQSRKLFEQWLQGDLPPQQRAFGEQLLRLT